MSKCDGGEDADRVLDITRRMEIEQQRIEYKKAALNVAVEQVHPRDYGSWKSYCKDLAKRTGMIADALLAEDEAHGNGVEQ